ncbi:hypothetical protein F4809DRAFT_587106 [Biscogniauxia mediterranea]|nr:hypothetical protein F4809DRAFT_587106 [Biscogniauxia mediterranea]
MGVYYETIPESMIKWAIAQKIFWVSTAPLSGNGHVNVSPKGGPYFGIPDNKTFWYIDLTGSGNETISHLLEPGNGRITVMFSAFDGPPRILRFWGKGRVLESGTPAFDAMVAREKIRRAFGMRSVIVVDVHQVGSSCGFSVPLYDFREFRTTLNDHFARKEERFLRGDEKESMDRYWAHKNAWSMDGLPGMPRGLVAAKKHSVAPIKKMVGPLAPRNGTAARTELHISYIVIAFLTLLVALLAATHPAFQYFAAQQSIQEIMLQVRSTPGGSPSAIGLPD